MKNLAQAIPLNPRPRQQPKARRKATLSAQPEKRATHRESLPCSTLTSAPSLIKEKTQSSNPLNKLANSTLKEWHPEEQPRERLST